MAFNSYLFFLFFGAVVLFYYFLPSKYRWILLLAASYYVYSCWKAEYVLLIASTTLIDFFIARAIGQSHNRVKRKRWLILGLFLNTGTLFLFKYLDFFSQTLEKLFNHFNIFITLPSFKLLLPVGISYYTFKKISYLIDVYRETIPPTTHLGKFALYVSFFPTLIAGPIDRAHDLLPQFSQKYNLDGERFINGLKLIVWGLFKKVVIADYLALIVDPVFSHPDQFPGIALLMATLFFSIRIYADFSGYTDMAIGFAQVLGFQLADNFNRPYSATSIIEFWRRWHISLTTWLRDYLFLPLAYTVSRRLGKDKAWHIKNETWAYIIGTLVTMTLCGLWHGAGWNFILWGTGHGIFLIIAFATRKTRKKWRRKLVKPAFKKIYHYARVSISFFSVSLLWIFFKTNTVTDALYILSRVLNPFYWTTHHDKILIKKVIISWPGWILPLLTFVLMWLVHWLEPHQQMRQMLAKKNTVLRWTLYVLLVLAIMNLGQVKTLPFIYLEF